MNDAARIYRRNMIEYAELYGDDWLDVVEVTDADLQQIATAHKKVEAEQRQMRSRVYRRRMLEQAELFGESMAQVEEGN